MASSVEINQSGEPQQGHYSSRDGASRRQPDKIRAGREAWGGHASNGRVIGRRPGQASQSPQALALRLAELSSGGVSVHEARASAIDDYGIRG